MIYYIDQNTKKIVKGIVQSEEARERRRKKGQETEFDIKVEEAIRKAQEEMVIRNCCAGSRITIIHKLHESLEDNRPWEKMGDTLCHRRLFYAYRIQYMWRIAVNLGIILGHK